MATYPDAAFQKLGIDRDELEKRRMYRLHMEGVANIKEWGAIGDGKKDDTAAIEAAIDAVVQNECGGVVFVPAGSFKVSKRLAITPHKPFAIDGNGPDICRLVWSGDSTEGISITPKGCLDPTCNDAAVKVSGVALLCNAESGKSAALLISGEEQIGKQSNGKTALMNRSVNRVRVTSVALRGGWKFGLVLRSTHLAEVEHLAICGVGPNKGSAAAVLMDGAGAPTGHTLENLRVFHFGTAIHVKSDTNGRIEGVKVHNCNLVAVQTGIRADSVLELSAVQNHINCSSAGIIAIDADQCFFMANLIYHNAGEGHGIHLRGENSAATAHTIIGNTIIGVQNSSKLAGITLDEGIAGATIQGNHFIRNEHALARPNGAKGHLAYVSYMGNVARNTTSECQGTNCALQSSIAPMGSGSNNGGGGGGGGNGQQGPPPGKLAQQNNNGHKGGNGGGGNGNGGPPAKPAQKQGGAKKLFGKLGF